MPEIKIAVINKVPKIVGDIKCIVADNSDYTIRFTFDDMWDDGEKTVYFVRENGFAFPAAKTKDDTVKIPNQHDAAMHSMLFIGVQQGNVKTSRPVDVRVTAAITDMIDDDAVQPDESLWKSVLSRIEELEKNGGGGIGMLTVNATKNADGTLTTDYSSAEIIEHINAGGDTRLSLESGIHVPFLGIEDGVGVIYAVPTVSAEAALMNVVTVIGNTVTVTLEEYDPENAGFAKKEYAYAAAMARADKPVSIAVDLAEDNSFVIPDLTAERLYEMAQSGEVRLTGVRANEDGGVVMLVADIRGESGANDGVLYTAAADMQITSVPVLVGLETSGENTNGEVWEAPAAGAGSSSSGGALNLQYYGAALTDITLSKTYTYDDVRAALLANRPITLTTYNDGVGEKRGIYHVVPGASLGQKGVRFVGFHWTETLSDDNFNPLPDLGWTPTSAVLAQDGTITFEDEWFEGYAKQTEVDSLSEAIADKLDADKLTEAVNEALAQAKASGEFDGEDGQDGEDGKDGSDYVLTEDDKAEIAEIAAGLVDVPEGGGSGETWDILMNVTTEEDVTNVAQSVAPDGHTFDEYTEIILLAFITPNQGGYSSGVKFNLFGTNGWIGQWDTYVTGIKDTTQTGIPLMWRMQWLDIGWIPVYVGKAYNSGSMNNGMNIQASAVISAYLMNYNANSVPTNLTTVLYNQPISALGFGGYQAVLGAGSKVLVYGKRTT